MVCRLRKNEWLKGCRISASFLMGSKCETLKEQREIVTNQHGLPLVPVLGGQKGAKSACKKKKKKKKKSQEKKLLWDVYVLHRSSVQEQTSKSNLSRGSQSRLSDFDGVWGDALLGDRGNCMVKLSYSNLEIKLYRWIYVYTIKARLFRVHGSAKSVTIICNAV